MKTLAIAVSLVFLAACGKEAPPVQENTEKDLTASMSFNLPIIGFEYESTWYEMTETQLIEFFEYLADDATANFTTIDFNTNGTNHELYSRSIFDDTSISIAIVLVYDSGNDRYRISGASCTCTSSCLEAGECEADTFIGCRCSDCNTTPNDCTKTSTETSDATMFSMFG